MRWLTTVLFSFFALSLSKAQHQEQSLVDRLLRPNVELQNSAQTKKFSANSAIAKRGGTVGTFYLQPNRTDKSFAAERSYSARQYASSKFNSGAGSVLAGQNRSSNKPARLGSSGLVDIHSAHDVNGAVATREYADEHQFREQGKSQKSLDRQNPPLTIDQVRELLNKNK